MSLESKIILAGAFICLIDAFVLLLHFDSVAGFLLGSFGFVIGLFSSALVTKLEG